MSRLHFHDYYPPPADLRAEVVAGLSAPRKYLPPKFFYDETGSQLFDAICTLPEYYPTRTEINILRQYGTEIAALLGRAGSLIELGSGSNLKIRVLLEAVRPAIYLPIDISRTHLHQSVTDLAAAFPDLDIHAICADYTRPFTLPEIGGNRQRAAFFPGSSVGNFDPPAAEQFLRHVGTLLGPGGHLLIGVDLRKDPELLHAAYNDAQGVTAAFNLNLLRRINRELGADFDLAGFRHQAFFAAAHSRIEMHLVSIRAQQVTIAGQVFRFAPGETIHTENSYKYTIAGFQALARAAGFTPRAVWCDAAQWFSVHGLLWTGT